MTERQAEAEYNYRRSFLRHGLQGTPAQIEDTIKDTLGTKEQYIANIINNAPLAEYILQDYYPKPNKDDVPFDTTDLVLDPSDDNVIDTINEIVNNIKNDDDVNVGSISDGYHTFDELY